MPGMTPPGAGLLNVLQSMTTMQDAMSQQTKDGQTPGMKITTTTDSDGTTHQVELGDDDLKTIMGTLKNYAQVLEGYKQEIGRLETQQQSVQRNPILNVLATVAGSTALQDKRLPPVVRAMGDASRQLNPTYQELENRKLALGTKMAEMSGQEANLVSSIEGRAASRQDRAERTKLLEMGLKDREKAEQDRVMEKSQARSDARYKTALQHYDNQIKTTGGKELTEGQFREGMKARGVADKDRIDSAFEEYKGAAKAERDRLKDVKEEKAYREKNSPSGMKRQDDLDRAQGLAQHLIERIKEGDPGDIDSLKQITGAFGTFRGMVVDALDKEAKKQGLPPVSMSKLERIVKTEDEFASGTKRGAQVVSYGQFGQHIGELSDSFKDLSSVNAEYANKSINWLKKHATDNPKLARVLTDLEPVQEEFERFLNSPYAPHDVNQKAVRTMLNEDLPINARVAAMNEMGKTVKARWTELANQYKVTTGFDLNKSHPISPEGVAGLAKVGVTMPKVEPTYDWVDGKIILRQ